MRPDDHGRQDAAKWNVAMTDKVAYREGVEQARREAGGDERVKAMLAAKQGTPEA